MKLADYKRYEDTDYLYSKKIELKIFVNRDFFSNIIFTTKHIIIFKIEKFDLKKHICMNDEIYVNCKDLCSIVKAFTLHIAFMLLSIASAIFFMSLNIPDRPGLVFPYRNMNITIGVIVYSVGNKTRLNTSYNSYGQFVESFYPESKYSIVCNMHSEKFVGEHFQKYMNFTAFFMNSAFSPFPMFITMMENFTKSQNTKWLLRTTDDVGIDLFELQKYLDHLENHYNPYEHVVIKGQYTRGYIHGGAGVLISRAGAIVLLELLKKFPYQEAGYGDDVYWGRWFRAFLNSTELHTNAFMSSRTTEPSLDLLLVNKSLDYKECGPTLMNQPNHIAVWHAGNRDLQVITHMNEFKKKLPENFYIQLAIYGMIEFCNGTNSSLFPHYYAEDINFTKVTLQQAIGRINNMTDFSTKA